MTEELDLYYTKFNMYKGGRNGGWKECERYVIAKSSHDAEQIIKAEYLSRLVGTVFVLKTDPAAGMIFEGVML